MGCARVRVGGIKIPFHAQVLTKFTLHTEYLDLGKRGHFVADTLLQTQMFPRLSARTTFVADTNFVSGTQKMFLILFRNILCLQQMFASLRSMETQHSLCVPRVCMPKRHREQQCVRNNVSSFAGLFVNPQISCLFTTLHALMTYMYITPTYSYHHNTCT